jgi:hypothetical protein
VAWVGCVGAALSGGEEEDGDLEPKGGEEERRVDLGGQDGSFTVSFSLFSRPLGCLLWSFIPVYISSILSAI